MTSRTSLSQFLRFFLPTFRPPKRLTSTKCTNMYFRQSMTTALLESAESMWLDRVSNPRPLAFESDALPTALHVPTRVCRPFKTLTLDLLCDNHFTNRCWWVTSLYQQRSVQHGKVKTFPLPPVIILLRVVTPWS